MLAFVQYVYKVIIVCAHLCLYIYVEYSYKCEDTFIVKLKKCINLELKLLKNWYDMIWYATIWYDTIYMLTAMGFTPGRSSTVHIYTQTIHRTTQLTNWEDCEPCPVFGSYTLAFALQLRKKREKSSVGITGECQLARWKQNIQNRAYITIRIPKYCNKIHYLQN